jgi:hypothetical protein
MYTLLVEAAGRNLVTLAVQQVQVEQVLETEGMEHLMVSQQHSMVAVVVGDLVLFLEMDIKVFKELL